MGESSDNHIGFNSRAAALLNNHMFSDVEIQVKDGTNHKTFLAHKLFLSMSSREFASMFYGKFESPKFIKIFDFKPHTVYLMLQFLYTNKLDLHSIEESRQLYSLSKKFGIRVLQELCIDFISKEELSAANVLHMYDCALREKFAGLLSRCQDVISIDTKAVFKSSVFVKASADVVENILKLDRLTVESELDVLDAVVRWAQKHRTRDKDLRECLMPLFPHIRFLTLRVEEFADFVRRHDILNGHESSLITRKLVQPNSPLELPSHLCADARPRKLQQCNGETPLPISAQAKQSPKSSLKLPSHLPADTKPPKPQQCNGETPLPISAQAKQSFKFPLQQSQKVFSAAFNGDVKSVLSLKLLKGAVLIHSFVLRIDEHDEEEALDVFLNVLNRSTSKSLTYNAEKPKGGAIVLNFDQPLKVVENSPVQIEVIIEDLKLNRCSIVKNTTFELNWGLDVVANMTLTSNQISESGECFFLISRLVYSPV